MTDNVYDMPEYVRIQRDPAPKSGTPKPILQITRSTRDGSHQAIRRGPGYSWTQSFTALVTDGDLGRFEAFLAKTEPPLNAIRCVDYAHSAEYDKSYDRAHVTYAGSLTATSAVSSGKSIAVEANFAGTLYAGRQIQIGDNLHILQNDVTVTNGGAAIIKIYPPLFAGVAENDIITINQAKGLWFASVSEPEWIEQSIRQYRFELTSYYNTVTVLPLIISEQVVILT